METRILKTLPLVQQVREQISSEVAELKAKGVSPKLVVVLIGDDPASSIYVSNKKKACEKVGIEEQTIVLDSGVTQSEVLELVGRLNSDPAIHGFFVQSPIPNHLNISELQKAIDPNKDVDGFHPENVGGLWLGCESSFVPCTPLGVIEILKWAGVELSGKNAVIIGRSPIVGKPMAALLLSENCTVSICHSKTENLAEITRTADILVSAVGRKGTVTKEMIKEGAVLVDVGINALPEGADGKRKIVGDIDFDSVIGTAASITPVPGGVGPMTIAMLLRNTVKAAKRGVF